MQYSSRSLKQGDSGEDVQELQIRLAGFSGGYWDGVFGPGTEAQVKQFQRAMNMIPTGIADSDTFTAIEKFAEKYPLDFSKLKCDCGQCSGFGHGLNKGVYRDGEPHIEQYHLYEYPGIHRAILWASRAIFLYNPSRSFEFSSGYRCSIKNKQKGRTTTNHMGKAVDVDDILKPGEDKKDDIAICNALRADTVETSKAQIGWSAPNTKSFEPSDIAPSWLHYDVRSYEALYLDDKFFCKSLEELDGPKGVIMLQTGSAVESVAASQPSAQKNSSQTSILYTLIDFIFSWFRRIK